MTGGEGRAEEDRGGGGGFALQIFQDLGVLGLKVGGFGVVGAWGSEDGRARQMWVIRTVAGWHFPACFFKNGRLAPRCSTCHLRLAGMGRPA